VGLVGKDKRNYLFPTLALTVDIVGKQLECLFIF